MSSYNPSIFGPGTWTELPVDINLLEPFFTGFDAVDSRDTSVTGLNSTQCNDGVPAVGSLFSHASSGIQPKHTWIPEVLWKSNYAAQGGRELLLSRPIDMLDTSDNHPSVAGSVDGGSVEIDKLNNHSEIEVADENRGAQVVPFHTMSPDRQGWEGGVYADGAAFQDADAGPGASFRLTKRYRHRLVERKYRQSLDMAFKELQATLPSMLYPRLGNGQSRVTRITVVASACDYIQALEDRATEMDEHCHKLEKIVTAYKALVNYKITGRVSENSPIYCSPTESRSNGRKRKG